MDDKDCFGKGVFSKIKATVLEIKESFSSQVDILSNSVKVMNEKLELLQGSTFGKSLYDNIDRTKIIASFDTQSVAGMGNMQGIAAVDDYLFVLRNTKNNAEGIRSYSPEERGRIYKFKLATDGRPLEELMHTSDLLLGHQSLSYSKNCNCEEGTENSLILWTTGTTPEGDATVNFRMRDGALVQRSTPNAGRTVAMIRWDESMNPVVTNYRILPEFVNGDATTYFYKATVFVTPDGEHMVVIAGDMAYYPQKRVWIHRTEDILKGDYERGNHFDLDLKETLTGSVQAIMLKDGIVSVLFSTDSKTQNAVIVEYSAGGVLQRVTKFFPKELDEDIVHENEGISIIDREGETMLVSASHSTLPNKKKVNYLLGHGIGDAYAKTTEVFPSEELTLTTKFDKIWSEGTDYSGGVLDQETRDFSEIYRWRSHGELHLRGRVKSFGAGQEAMLNTLRTNGSIAIIGDSVTHGKGLGDVLEHSWARQVSKAVQAAQGQEDYGFETLQTYGDRKLVHEVTMSDGWTHEAGDSPNGRVFSSAVEGSKITIVVPAKWSMFNINVCPDNAFVAEVKVNGSQARKWDDSEDLNLSISQSSKAFTNESAMKMIPDDEGMCTIEITVVSGTVKINGLIYKNNGSGLMTHIYAQSGRTIKDMSTKMIDTLMQDSEAIIFALGLNDMDFTGEEKLQTLEKLKYFMDKCESHKRRVIVLDLLGAKTFDHWLKMALKYYVLHNYRFELIDMHRLLTENNLDLYDETIIENDALYIDTKHPKAILNKRIGYLVMEKMKIYPAEWMWTDSSLESITQALATKANKSDMFCICDIESDGTIRTNSGAYLAKCTRTATGKYMITFADTEGNDIALGYRRIFNVMINSSSLKMSQLHTESDGIMVSIYDALTLKLTNAYFSLTIRDEAFI